MRRRVTGRVTVWCPTRSCSWRRRHPRRVQPGRRLRPPDERPVVRATVRAGCHRRARRPEPVGRPAHQLGRWAATWCLLGIAMPLTIAAAASPAWWALGLLPAAALLFGAAFAPTDPVLALDVQTGPPTTGDPDADEPDEVRFGLTSESSLNDGLAFPFSNLALLVAPAGLHDPERRATEPRSRPPPRRSRTARALHHERRAAPRRRSCGRRAGHSRPARTGRHEPARRSQNDEVGSDVRTVEPTGRSRTIARVPGRAGELVLRGPHLPVLRRRAGHRPTSREVPIRGRAPISRQLLRLARRSRAGRSAGRRHRRERANCARWTSTATSR